MPNRNDYIFNKPVGGAGGDSFGDELWSDTPVSEVEAWYGHAWNADFTVLKGIKVHWGNKSSRRVGKPSDGELHTSYSFAPNERVRWMTLKGADPGSQGRCDSLSFEANNPFAAGGTGGSPHNEDLGNHVFHGRRHKPSARLEDHAEAQRTMDPPAEK
ncbi:hypothetical protein APSETT444_007671 [Aspergillus pseudonomiae]